MQPPLSFKHLKQASSLYKIQAVRPSAWERKVRVTAAESMLRIVHCIGIAFQQQDGVAVTRVLAKVWDVCPWVMPV
jgi:hypothetical protein